MKCRRCKGWIVQERVFTLEGSASMLRCFYCGEQIDQVIMDNRNRSEISQVEKYKSKKDGLHSSPPRMRL